MTGNDAKLFTPGPLNTSDSVRRAMGRDIGSRSSESRQLTLELQRQILEVAQAGPDFIPALLQGSGTFSVEAMLLSMLPEHGKVLVVENGIYGQRMAEICRVYKINHQVLSLEPTIPVQQDKIAEVLQYDNSFTHLATVHFETALGVLNDIDMILNLCEKFNVKLLLDAMSSFAAVKINFDSPCLSAVAASANKCLHSVPGLGFVLVKKDDINSQTIRRSLSLDLKEQLRGFEQNQQWRFTPPTHVMLALRQAILEFMDHGGTDARFSHYKKLNVHLTDQLARLGIRPIIEQKYRAPMITTYGFDRNISITDLFDFLEQRGLMIYPSKSNRANTFRIGCIGELCLDDIDRLVDCIEQFLQVPGT